ncbi:MAG: hypothetical protein GY928_30620 [Colwellia sp.]|nr:hypothetical protein [Colwellia sp.]
MVSNGSETISQELSNLVAKGRYPYVKINFSTGELDPGIFSDEVMVSIDRYRKWLPQHIEAHELDFEKISDISLNITPNDKGPSFFITALDDKGNQYSIDV